MASSVLSWIGPARADRLLAAVSGHLADWHRDWAASPLKLHCAPLPVERVPDSAPLAVASLAHARLHAWAPEDCAQRLAAALADVPAGGGPAAFQEEVGDAALDALFDSLLGGSARRLSPSDAVFHGSDPRRTGFCFEVQVGALRMKILLDPSACNQVDRPVRAEPNLVSRASALAPAALTLEAHMALGRISLPSIGALKPGEVLRTGVPLDTTVELRVAGGAVLSRGQLAAIDGHKAIRIGKTTF